MSACIAKFEYHPEIAPNRFIYAADLEAFARLKGVPSDAEGLSNHPEFKWRTWYKKDYKAIFSDIQSGKLQDRSTFAELIKSDLFFIVHFVMGINKANCPFVVSQCRMVEDGPQTGTVDVWAREHFKSVIITIALTVKRIVNNPECTTAIFSFKKPAAEKFLDSIRNVLQLKIMVWAFPTILYENPKTEAPYWSLQGGIRVKRESTARKEHTVEAYGLIEGMPTGLHTDHRVYDDVETADVASSPDQLEILMDRFEMSRNLGSDGGTEQIIGTFYSHTGFLVKMGVKKTIHGNPMYILRSIPATEDGTINGKPVLFSQEYLDSKKMDGTFNSQQLCNPTPSHDAKLRYSNIVKIKRRELPEKRFKVVIIDPAGDKDVQSGNKNDAWAMVCLSVRPVLDDLGLSDIYIEDGIAGEMGSAQSQDAAVTIYCRNGRVDFLAVERVGTDSAWLHVKNALAAKGRYLEVKKPGKFGGNLILLAPANRSKNKKIVDNLEWPLNNAKIHMVDDLDDEFTDQLEAECDKFPFFHVNILDAISYIYDILGDPTMQFKLEREKKPSKKIGYVSPGAA